MATAIGKNQYDYLNGLVQSGGGNGEWAKNQLSNSTYTPQTTPAPAVPTNTNVPTAPATNNVSAAVIPNGSVPKPPTSPVTTTAAPAANPGVQQYSDFQKQQSDLMDQLKSYMQPMNYDPNTDPRYLASKQLAAAAAKEASGSAMETLNSRGILNSSVTRDDVADIEQKYAAQAAAQIPEFYNQAYQQSRDRVGDVFKLLGNSQDQQQRGIENNNADRTFGIQEGQLTGNYTPASSTIDAVRKQMSSNSAAYVDASPEEQKRLHDENLKLAASIGGSDTTGNGDYAFGPMRTVQGQQLDLNQKIDDRNFKYQTVQDAIKNGMSQQQIDNQAKQFADRLGYDYDNMNSNDKQAWAQIAISQQNANTSSANSKRLQNSSNGENASNKISTAQFNDIYDTLNKKYGVAGYTKDSSGNDKVSYSNTNNPDQKAKIVVEVLGAGLSDDQTLQLLNKMGITEAEARELLGG